MSGATINTDTTTTLVLVNTATNSNVTVNLNPGWVGQTITVRDSSGKASATNPITIQSGGNPFNTSIAGITSSFTLQQAYGFATFQYGSSYQWTILNTFGLQPQETIWPAEGLTVSTIRFYDQTGSGTSLLNVSNATLLLNGEPIQGDSGQVPDPLTLQSLQVSTITVSSNLHFSSDEDTTRLNVSGTVATNFLTLNDQAQPQQSKLSAQNNILYRNSYPINSIGAYIEFETASQLGAGSGQNITMVYPLYVGILSNLQNGWWDTTVQSPLYADSSTGYVSGIILLPGFSIIVNSGPNFSGSNYINTSNTTSLPVYQATGGSTETTLLKSSYVLSAIN